MILKVLSLIASAIHKRRLKKYLEFIGIDPIKLSELNKEERIRLIRAKHGEAKEMLSTRGDITKLIEDLTSNNTNIREPLKKKLRELGEDTQKLIRWEHEFPYEKAADF